MGDSSPDEGDCGDIYTLQDTLRQVIEQKNLGSFDGNEFGHDEAVLFTSGPDGEAMFAGIEPVLRDSPLCRGATANICRYESDSLI